MIPAGYVGPTRTSRLDDELQQGGRIQIEHQRSCARILARVTDGRSTPLRDFSGGPKSSKSPLPRLSLPAASNWSSRVPATGTSLATGRPRTVTSMLSPRRTRSTVLAAFCWSCLTPTLSMCGTVAGAEVDQQASTATCVPALDTPSAPSAHTKPTASRRSRTPERAGRSDSGGGKARRRMGARRDVKARRATWPTRPTRPYEFVKKSEPPFDELRASGENSTKSIPHTAHAELVEACVTT